VHAIKAGFAPLREFPELGAACEQLRAGLRAIPYRGYVIYYTASDNELTIIRVLHGARDARTIFGEPTSPE
jgi:plasmid stabilization system protein ParE